MNTGRASQKRIDRRLTRRAACGLASDRAAYLKAAQAVSASLSLPLDEFAFPGRRICGRYTPQKRVLAHQMTVYLTVTAFDISLSRAARAIGQWRTSIRAALARIEDRRDDAAFDGLLAAIERQVAGQP